MNTNKTQPTNQPVDEFLAGVGEIRQNESYMLADMMEKITGEKPVMWGPSIVGFGVQHYQYDSGRQGVMPLLSFSPRKRNITIYFAEGFDRYTKELSILGTHTQSVSCLYIPTLRGIDEIVLENMLRQSFKTGKVIRQKPTTVDEYIDSIPLAARKAFNELRGIVKETIPNAEEVFSYGIVGYKTDSARARVYIAGWKDRVTLYPVPKDALLQEKLKNYIKGKGTVWFCIDNHLPRVLIKQAVLDLVEK